MPKSNDALEATTTFGSAVLRAATDCRDPRCAGLVALALACVLVACNALSPRFFPPWRTTSLIGFVVNCAAVGSGGRFDSAVANGGELPWPNLVNPAPFAFAIWGIIFIGEALGVGYTFFFKLADTDGLALKAATPAWLAGNLSQALWCAAFRPWALEKLWLSTLFLALTAGFLYVSLSEAHGIYEGAQTTVGVPPMLFWTVYFPRFLHLGWVSAATLVNLNAWMGYSQIGMEATLTTAFLSIAFACCLGVVFTLKSMPTAALAVAWALNAVGLGTPTGAIASSLGPVVMTSLSMTERLAAAALLGFSVAVFVHGGLV